AVLRLDKAVLLVEDEHPRPGPVQEVGPAVAVNVANRQRVALDRAADAVRPQAHPDRNVLEPARRRGGLARSRRGCSGWDLGLALVAVEAKAVEAVAQQDVGAGIAVGIEPRGRRQGV